jgi:hypothetical protein
MRIEKKKQTATIRFHHPYLYFLVTPAKCRNRLKDLSEVTKKAVKKYRENILQKHAKQRSKLYVCDVEL